MSTTAFDEQVIGTLRSIRGALTELVSSVGADASRPQELARQYRVNRNLSWKISKIINATDPYDVVPHLPGHGGLERLLSAFETASAPRCVIDAVRNAMRDFDQAVERHAGDRSTFELMLSSMAPDKLSPERVEAARRQAFIGNSGIWGVQCRVRLASYFLAPNGGNSEMLDGVVVGGLHGVRRLRPDASVPLFMRQAYHNDDGTLVATPVEPIDATSGPNNDMMLMRDFCSPDLPTLDMLPADSSLRFELPVGPVGNTALMDWTFGWYMRSFASRYQTEKNRVAEHSTRMFVPTELLICDLQVHRSLDFALDPKPYLYSQLAGPATYPIWRDEDILPIMESVQSIGDGMPVVATPHVPNYPQIVQRVYDQLGWTGRDFHGFRITIKYPPIPSVLILRSQLPDRPTA